MKLQYNLTEDAGLCSVFNFLFGNKYNKERGNALLGYIPLRHSPFLGSGGGGGGGDGPKFIIYSAGNVMLR